MRKRLDEDTPSRRLKKEANMANALTVEVSTTNGSVGVLKLAGDVTGESEDALMEAYGQAGGEGAKAIVLDFAGLEYMNSGGIGLLVTLLVRAKRHKQKLLAFGLTEHYRQIFELTRLDEAIEIFATEAEAVAAGGQP
jgi:anti-sigma B factor antagonist